MRLALGDSKHGCDRCADLYECDQLPPSVQDTPFVQNLGRGHYEIAPDVAAGDQFRVAFDELTLRL